MCSRHRQIWAVITLIDEHKLTISICRSCPELDKDIGAGLADRTPVQFGNQDFPNIMEKNISRSAHSIKVGLIIFILSSPQDYLQIPKQSRFIVLFYWPEL